MKKALEKITNRHIFFVMLAGFLLSLLPVLLLALYNYPCADDFSASCEVHHAWVETGSLWEVLKAAAENVKYNYMEWSGVFASVFWTSLQPGLFGEGYYGLTTWITVAVVCMGAGYLFAVILGKYFNSDKYLRGCVTVIFLFLLIHCMPDGKEGLYWHAGVVNYTLAYGFLLLLIGMELSLFGEENRKTQWMKCAAACVLAVCVGGGNLITALWGSLVLTGIWIALTLHAWRGKKQRPSLPMPPHKQKAPIVEESVTAGASLAPFFASLLPVLVLLLSFAAAVLAPGNSVRMGEGSGMHPVKAVLVSLYYGLNEIFELWITWPVVCLLALTVPFFWQIVKKAQFAFPMPGAVALLGYGLSCAAFTPSLYATGNIMAGRLQDTAYYVWLLTVFCVMLYSIGWLHRCLAGSARGLTEKEEAFCDKATGKSMDESDTTPKPGMAGKVYILGLTLFWLVGSVLTAGIEEDIYVGTEALVSLASGQAARYREEQKERLAILADPTESHAALPAFDNPPGLLMFQDISEDEKDWINQAVAEYYYKESVVLKKNTKDEK